jgi:hypothetical protein
MDQVQESACLSRCVGETRLTINKASNLVQSLRQFQKTVNFDAAPQVLSGLQLSGSTSRRGSSRSRWHAAQAASDCGIGAPA